MAARIELREITQDSLGTVLDLAVEPEQAAYVAPNARSIAEAYFEPHAWFRAVYADDDPVGFVMLFRDPPDAFWVWRFMIDARHQGKGYGRRALELVVEEARTAEHQAVSSREERRQRREEGQPEGSWSARLRR